MVLLILTQALYLAAAPCSVILPPDLQQGDLVRGRAPAASMITYAGRRLAQTATGEFVFGIASNAPKTASLTIKTSACSATLSFPVASRSYRTERVDGVPQNTVTPDAETAKRIALEGAMIQKARAVDSNLLFWQQPFQWPASGRISGVYGSQRILNGLPSSPHLGLDMAAATGTPVVAALSGKVSLAHSDMIMTGKTLIIDHGFGVNTIYIHMSELAVEQGQMVNAGQRIGAIGSTGRSSGPHLHFQVQWYQEKLDPALVLPAQN